MKACSFFWHRDTSQTEELKQKVRETVERLIVEEGVDTFLFGCRSVRIFNASPIFVNMKRRVWWGKV